MIDEHELRKMIAGRKIIFWIRFERSLFMIYAILWFLEDQSLQKYYPLVYVFYTSRFRCS